MWRSDERDDLDPGVRLTYKTFGLDFDLRELVHRRRACEAVLFAYAFGGDVQRFTGARDEVMDGIVLTRRKKSLTTCDGE